MARQLSARWKQLTLRGPSAPCARSSHGVTAVGGKAYVFGGEAVARHAIDSSVHCLDVRNGWRTVTTRHAPSPRLGHAQCAVRDTLMLFGGRDGVGMGEGDLNDLWAYDVSAGEWSQVEAAEGAPPSGRSFHRMAAVGDKLYVFGGCGAEGRLADLHEYDTKLRRWSALPSPPDLPGRGGACFEDSADGAAVWVCGGFCGFETNDLLRFDLGTHTWQRSPSDWLRPRSVCASWSVAHPSGPAVLVFGGEVSPSDKGHEGAGGFASDLVAFDAATGAPVDVVVDDGPAPEARGWGAAAALSSTEAVLFGGLAGTDAAPRRLDDAWLLTVN